MKTIMQKRLGNKITTLVLHLISSLVFGAKLGHLEKLNSKFPYGLLSDDYSILTINDLAVNACDADPKPFNPTSHYGSYQYWQCFENKTISFDCDSNGKAHEQEGVMGLIVIKAAAKGIQHEYIERKL